MRALVTGGGGFLGSAIVRLLVARGDSVRSFSRGDYPLLRELGVDTRRGDLRDPADVAAACEGQDLVFHVAAMPPPWGRPADYEAINVGGTRNVLAGCRTAGVRWLVHTSTPSVVASDEGAEGVDETAPYARRFLSDYARTKAEAEQLVLAASSDELVTVALRPHLVWGPGDPHFLPRFVSRQRSGQLRRIGEEDPQVDVTYIDNAATGHILAADRLRDGTDIGGRAFFLSNDEPVGLWTMVDRMLAAAGEGPVTGAVPVWMARAAASMVEGTHRALGLAAEPRLTRFLVHEVTRAHWYDITAAKELLGYRPEVSVDEGLIRLERWCRSPQAAGLLGGRGAS